jgi:hypothetical protein
MRRLAVLFTLILSALALGLSTGHAAGAGPAIMRILPETFKVQGAAGGTLVAPVYINDAKDVGGFEFEVRFDGSLLTAEDVVEGDFLSYGGGYTACAPSMGEGVAHLGCVLLGGTGVSGSGLLGYVRLSFNEEFAGDLELLLMECEAADADGDALAVGTCGGALVTASPVPPAVPMSMSPASTMLQGTPGETFTVDVGIADVTDLGGLEFAVEFDDAVLNVSDIREGPFLASLGGDTVCAENGFAQSPSSSRATFACVVFGYNQAPDGSGTIAHVDFVVKAPFGGTTALTLTDCEVADIDGFNIPVSQCAGGAAQSSPTPTPTATATPTPPPPVGGVSLDPADGVLGARQPANEGSAWPALAAALGAGAIVIAAGAWLGWRRARS